ncbi:hypothetical protein HDV00_009252 [Rhizophlyctis rosea]|nr:hypothetical protein HDV00_009252 [Rhizophlyctis rosea]
MNAISLFLLFFEDIQILSYAFEPHLNFAGLPDWMPYVFNPLGYQPHDHGQFSILFYFAIGITALSLILTVWVGFTMRGSKMEVIWPLQLLRALTKLLSTVLLLPCIEIFLPGFLCHDESVEGEPLYLFSNPSLCRQWLHLVIPAAFGLVYLAVQAPLFSLVYFQMDPSGKSYDDKNTGRVDTVFAVLRLILAVAHESVQMAPAYQIAMVIITSAVTLYLMVRHQPFFNPKVNDIRSGIFMAAFWSGIQGAIGLGLGGYTSTTGFAVMVALLVPEFAIGFGISVFVRRRICKGVYRRLKARQAHEEGKLPASKSSTRQIQATREYNESSKPPTKPHSKPPLKKSLSASEKGVPDSSSSSDNIFADLDNIVTSSSPEPVRVFGAESDVELACRFLQHNRTPKALMLADALFDAGMQQFPKSAFLTLLKVYYIKTFQIRDLSQVSQYLHLSKVLRPSFDIRFFIFFEERAMEQEDRKDELQASQLNITRHLEIIAMENNARKWHLEALLSQKSLWEYIKSDAADADCIPYLLEIVGTNRMRANRYYQQMLSKYPVLRRYSSFLMTVVGDTEQAKKLLDRAEDIENAEAREHTVWSANARDNDDFGNSQRQSVNQQQFQPNFPDHSIPRVMSESMDSTDPQVETSYPPLVDQPLQNRSRRPSVQFGAAELTPVVHHSPRRSLKTSHSEGPGGAYAVEGMGAFGGEGVKFERSPTKEEMDLQKISLGQEWKKGPGSLPSVPSATSSQKDSRQFKYLRGILETRLTGPINELNIMITVACLFLLALLVVGCLITLMTYSNISQAVNEAYTRMRPRAAAYRLIYLLRSITNMATGVIAGGVPREIMLPWVNQSIVRFADSLFGVWRDQIMPTLLKYNLNDVAAVKIKRKLPGKSTLLTYNPYFLAQLLLSNGQTIANLTATQAYNPSFFTSPAVRIFLDNIDAIGDAFQDVSSQGYDEFIAYSQGNMRMMYGLLVALLLAALLVGIFLVRPTIMRTTEREVQIVSLALTLPRKFINERIETLEVEVENIMEELGACVFLSTRSYYTIGTAMYVGETISNDTSTWLPGDTLMLLQDFANNYRTADESLMADNKGVPSLLRVASCQQFINQAGRCYLQQPNGCDPAVRMYQPQLSYTYDLVTSGLVNIGAVWYDAVTQFINDPPALQTGDNSHLIFINELLEDLQDAGPQLNDLLLAEVNMQNASAKSWNIFLFCLSFFTLVGSYIFVFRWITNNLKQKLLSISDLFFSLPVPLIQSIPELKRFIESGGAMIPTTEKKAK